MNNKTDGKRKAEHAASSFLKALLCSYVITGILLLILALILYKIGPAEETVNAAIILIYVVSAFSGGFVMGKLMHTRRFLWGLVTGILYFLLLLLISAGVYHGIEADYVSLLTTFLICGGGGMLGGMIS